MKRAALIAALAAAIGGAGCGDSGTPIPVGSLPAPTMPGTPTVPVTVTPKENWIGAWATAIYGPYPEGALGPAYAPVFPTNVVDDQSLRMIIHPSIAGTRVRACFSNLLGAVPLDISRTSLSLSGDGLTAAITAGGGVELRFGGMPSVSIPPGEKRCSDGADFRYAFGDSLAVSFHVPTFAGPISSHSEAFATQWVSAPGSGDVTADAMGAMYPLSARSFFFLSDFDVIAPAGGGTTISAFGDSITDGFVSTIGRNERYPDFLARRLQAAGIAAGVRNLGINGNTATDIKSGPMFGDAAVLRFGRDALAGAGVKSVFVLIGTNDLGSSALAVDVYAGLVELARQAHAAGVCIVVSTVLPRNDPPLPFGWDALTEEPQRAALNQMLLASTAFDAVADVATAMANPLLPDQPFQPYFVEGLHPNSVGMEVLAGAIPIEPLLPPPTGTCRR
ncbi:MAG: GDSL-type esterase/lipase family protein [Pseudomonadota bacterium]